MLLGSQGSASHQRNLRLQQPAKTSHPEIKDQTSKQPDTSFHIHLLLFPLISNLEAHVTHRASPAPCMFVQQAKPPSSRCILRWLCCISADHRLPLLQFPLHFRYILAVSSPQFHSSWLKNLQAIRALKLKPGQLQHLPELACNGCNF